MATRMAFLDTFLLKIRRGETPFYRLLKSTARRVLCARLPAPRALRPLLRTGYELHFGGIAALRRAATFFYFEPLFRARCVSVGRNLTLSHLPHVIGHTRIVIGNDVYFSGHVGVLSGRVCDEPTLVLRDGVHLGHDVLFSVNREIVVEENVKIASHCYLADSDGHPLDPQLRAANLPPRPEEIKPVRVCRGAWIGQGSYVQKGVTIGEGAVIGANSVVLTDIPPFCVALGNPARVVGFATAAPPAQAAAQPESHRRLSA